MWEFMKLEWRVECLWSIMLNNKYCSLAELVLRGELDDVLEGISENERSGDDYIKRLQYLRELITRGKEFLDLVDSEIHRAIKEIENPYPETDAPVLVGEMPIEE